jgi:hypothetical protein
MHPGVSADAPGGFRGCSRGFPRMLVSHRALERHFDQKVTARHDTTRESPRLAVGLTGFALAPVHRRAGQKEEEEPTSAMHVGVCAGRSSARFPRGLHRRHGCRVPTSAGNRRLVRWPARCL